jgi:hypothetical protein
MVVQSPSDLGDTIMSLQIPSKRTTDPSAKFSRTICGRRYPAPPKDAKWPTLTLPPNDLSNQIETAIRARSRLKDKASEYQDYESLVDDYLHDANVLREAVREVRQTIVDAWHLNLVFHRQGESNTRARDKFVNKHEARLVRLVDKHLIPPPSPLFARLEKMAPSLAFLELESALDEGITNFAEQVATLLETLVNRGMIGVIDWATESACDVSYFKTIVIEENQGSEIVSAQERVVGIRTTFFGYAEQIEETVFGVSKGQQLVRRGRYDLYLTKATAHGIEDDKVLIPTDVGEFLDSLPAWIRDMCRVVSGQELKRLVIVTDVAKEPWEDTDVIAVRLRERKHFCPVITIGHYVLTGWGAEEESSEAAARWADQLRVVAALLLFLAVGLCCLGQLASPVFSVAGALMAALSLMSFVASEQQRAISDQSSPSVKRLLPPAAIWAVSAIGLTALFGGIAAGNSMLVVFGLACVFLMAAALLSKSTTQEANVGMKPNQ